MFKHISITLLLILVLALIYFFPGADYIPYIWIVALPLIIILLGLGIYKTYTLKKGKYILFLSLFISSFLLAAPSIAQAQTYRISQERLQEAQLIIEEVERIPLNDRTREQQEKLEKAREDYTQAMKERLGRGSKACPTPKQLLLEYQEDCWTCDIVYLIVESMDKVITTFYKQLEEQHLPLILLSIGGLFWLVFRTLRLFLTWGMGDIGSYFTDVLKRILLLIFLSAILWTPYKDVLNIFITPIFTFSAGLTQSLSSIEASIETPQSTPQVNVEIYRSVLGTQPPQPTYCQNLNAESASPTDERVSRVLQYQASIQDRALPTSVRDSLLCIVQSIYQITVPPTVAGQYLMCMSQTQGAISFPTRLTPIIKLPDFSVWFASWFIIAAFFLLSAVFPFFLVDSFFRIGIVLLLMPFFIVTAAFPSTRAYTKRAFDVLISSLINFFMISLILVLLIQMFYTLMGPTATTLAELLAKQDYLGLSNTFGWAGGGRMIFASIAMLLIGFYLLSTTARMIQMMTGIGLSQGGGVAALFAPVGLAGAGLSLTKEIYDEPWEPSKHKAYLLRMDAQRRGYTDAKGVRHGLSKYHTLEARSRGMRRFIPKAADKAGNKVEKTSNTSALLTEKGIKLTGKEINQGTKFVFFNSGHFLGQFGMKMIGTTASAWYLAPFTLAAATVAFTGAGIMYALGGTFIMINNVANYVIRKTAKKTIQTTGKVTSYAIKKSARAIAYNKYLTKTMALVQKPVQFTTSLIAIPITSIYTRTLEQDPTRRAQQTASDIKQRANRIARPEDTHTWRDLFDEIRENAHQTRSNLDDNMRAKNKHSKDFVKSNWRFIRRTGRFF